MKTQQQIEQELSLKPFGFQQKVAACKVLYLAYQGRHHDHIQIEMRKLGNARWNNRCLYARWNNGKYLPGWPERYGWDEELGRSRRKAALPPGERKGSAFPAGPKNDHRGYASTPGDIAAIPDSKNSKNFLSWLKKLSGPYNWDWKFQRYVIDKLEQFERGDIKRLMLFVPPRHGKSELVTVRYAAWHLSKNPKSNIIIGSYNQKLANRFSRRIKNVYAEALAVAAAEAGAGAAAPTHDKTTCTKCIEKALECPYANAHPAAAAATAPPLLPATATATDPPAAATATATVARRANTDAEWETPEGGGVKAVGCGSGITGFGANLIIIDDPVKSRSEAESQTIRDKVFDWFNDDIYTRLEPDGKMILIQTRWHEDDLAGRLLREMQEDEDAEQWEVINFPAIAEEPAAGAVADRDTDSASVPGAVATGAATADNDGFPAAPKQPIYYIRNGQHYPIHTLGDPNKRRGSDPATFPPIELATAPPHRTAERLCLSDRPALDSPELAKRATDPRHSLKTIESDATGEASLTAVHGGIADRSATSPHSQNSPDSHDSPHSPNSPNSQDSPNSLDSRLTPLRDPLGRLPGDALCPERYPIERLMKTKKRLGTYSFTALYQQRPIPAEGGFFKRHWFKIINHIPPGLKWKRGYDLGISASPGADYTATARVAFDGDGNMYIDRVLRRRMEYPEQRRAILGLIATEHDTEHFIEKSANGNAVIQDLRRERGISERHFRGVEVRESKTARAFTWNALAEEGRVHLIRAAWNTDFIDEACSFPGGVNDDQIDAVSIAVKMLREEKRRNAHGF